MASPQEQIISEMIGNFGGLISLFFTTLFTTFVSPLLTTIAGWFGLTT